ncbi:hypothetical protein [Xanthomonas bromi]|uniref:hypothetical protein n=1 Tax=Xanthomonas bromi TaxID=56449 RepID=UPI001428A4F4|nr:hypothetical protein [Xanthomonas bromi]
MPSALAGHAVTPPGGRVGGVQTANSRASGEDTAPDRRRVTLLKNEDMASRGGWLL